MTGRRTNLRDLRRGILAAAVTALLVGVAACGGSPTTDNGDSGDNGAAPARSLDDVYAELNGLSGQERHDKLVELAKAEKGDFTVYFTTNEKESGPWMDSFTKDTGIKVNIYRASASDLQKRLTQEHAANHKDGADVVGTDNATLYQLEKALKIFLPLKSPYLADIREEVVYPTFTAYDANAYITIWNTNNVKPNEVPKSLEDDFTKFKGRLTLEQADWKWFATLVEGYFMAKKGMTEAQAIDLFNQAASGAAIVSGHTFMNTQIISGEYDVSPASYINASQASIDEGAPIAWKPAVEPLVMQPNGVAIHQYTDRPATSLLFVEHLLTDIQDQLPSENYVPMNTTAKGNPVDGLDVLFIDPEKMDAEQNKWMPLWEKVIQHANGQVLKEK